MNINLPRKATSANFSIFNQRVVVFIGANGSGKSRLGYWLEQNHATTHRVSAQKALNMPTLVSPTSKEVAQENFLYGTTNPDKNWLKVQGKNHSRWGNNPETHLLNDFQYLLTLLHTDEYEESIKYRAASKTNPDLQPPKTKLDIIQEIWDRILPNRKLIIKAGVIEASIPNSQTTYNAASMSDGERVIFYLIGEVLCAPDNSLLIIDEPENHVHKAIQSKLWNELESLRVDCSFAYLTHDIDFAVSRSNSIKIWMKNFTATTGWEYELLDEADNLPEHVYLEILGSRKDILFIEGDKSSLDFHIYKEIYYDKTIEPLGGCSKVLEATRSFNSLHQMHRLSAQGIIDRDRRSDQEVALLRGGAILVPDVAEIENLFLLEDVVRAFATLMNKNANAIFTQVRQNVLNFFNQNLTNQILLYTKHKLTKLSERGFNANFTAMADVEAAKNGLIAQLDVTAIYTAYQTEFQSYINANNYSRVLTVFNNKGLIFNSQVANLCGVIPNTYTAFIIEEIKKKSPTGNAMRSAMLAVIN